MMTRVLLVFAIAGCGEVKDAPIDGAADDGARSDGPSDGPPVAACDLAKPFGAAVVVPNLHNAFFNDTHATLSADEKTIFFASDRDGGGSPGAPIFHLYSATRTSADASFGAPALVGTLFSPEGESHPTVSADGNTVLFDTFRDVPGGGVVHIFTATRSNVAVDFGTPTLIDGEFMIMPSLTVDGGLLYTANLQTGRLSRLEKVGNGFGPAQNVNIPGSTSVVSPVTNDDLTIFVGLGDSQGAEIAVTTRPTITDAFPAPTQVVELKTAATFAEPSWLSPNGCRLYLTYGDSGGKTTIHVATRPE